MITTAQTVEIVEPALRKHRATSIATAVRRLPSCDPQPPFDDEIAPTASADSTAMYPLAARVRSRAARIATRVRTSERPAFAARTPRLAATGSGTRAATAASLDRADRQQRDGSRRATNAASSRQTRHRRGRVRPPEDREHDAASADTVGGPVGASGDRGGVRSSARLAVGPMDNSPRLRGVVRARCATGRIRGRR